MDPKNSHGPDRIDYSEGPGDLTEVHAAIQRENPEPTAESTPVPMWLIVTCGLAVCWAGVYIGLFNGGFKADVFNELNSSASLLFPAPSKGGTDPAVAELTLAEQGKAVYAQCAACHQPGGTGTPGAIPPLVKSEWVNGSEKRVVAILLKGITGSLNVEGATYNGVMPPWEAVLSNKKIAAVATYVRSSWGNTGAEISEAKVAAARKEFTSHTTPWTEAELKAIPEDATLPDDAAAAPAKGAAPAPTAGGAAKPAAAPAASAPAAGGAPAPAAAAPAPAAAGGPPSDAQLASGKMVYMTCMPCHQPTGAGLFPVFPPLTKSPYVGGPAERLVAIILKGNMGPFTVDGKPYNNIMPPQETALTDSKIADVATYVRNSFGNTASAVTTEQVTAARAKFADRKTAWTQPELDAWKE